MDFKLNLVVGNMEHLPVDSHGCNMIAKVEWRGNERKAGFLARFEKNYTSHKKVEENGTVSWNEGFDHICKFKRSRPGIYNSWIIVLQIEEVHGKAREKVKHIGKVKVDVTKFIQLENDKSIRIPISCRVGGHIAEAMLMVKLQFIKVESEDRNQVILTPRALSLSSFSPKPRPNSNIKTKIIKLCHNQSIKLPTADLTSEGRDYIDNDWHRQSCIQCLTSFKRVKVRPEENIKTLGLENNYKFEVGQWVKKKIVSRDEKMELVTDMFLASIDQRSKRAAGGSACTVLAVVIADWLHSNPKSLPLQCQFDELVLKGSSEWRNLCAEENHKVEFSDKHFDLDTVLKTSVKSLKVDTEKSYIGFFSMDEMPQGFDWLQEEISFDNIWNTILCTDVSEERIYIASWNDHFFVLKVESDAIYLLDTLGERLSEGCNQAYILKFDRESSIYRHSKNGKGSKSSQDLVSEGIACCKEYIKGFLAAIPLRELQQDINSGRAKLDLLHRLLQIDFHYTAPCTRKTC